MPQDAFTLLHTAKELNCILLNARVDKINQPDNDCIFMNVRANDKNLKLVLSSNAQSARIAITSEERQNPITAPGFCMLLRKHLTHAIIKEVSLVGFERIIKIVFDCKNDLREQSDKILYAEIMGKFSNLILVENNYILGALKQSSLDSGNLRPIFSGLKYQLPISQEKIEILDQEKCLNALENYNGTNPSQYIFDTFKGIAKNTAEQIVNNYREKYNSEDEFIKMFKTIDFYNYFKCFYVTPNIEPNVVVLSKPLDFFICDCSTIQGQKINFKSINEAVDFFFTKKGKQQQFENEKSKLLAVLNAFEKKLNKKMQIILEKKLSCADMETNKKYGEMIIANLYLLKTPQDKCELVDYSTPDYPTIEIKLDKNISPKQNAEKFFKKYNKQKKTLLAIAPQEVEINGMLDYISTMKEEISIAREIEELNDFKEELIKIELIKPPKSANDIKKKIDKPSKPRCFHYKGFDIFAGRNNIQNDILTLSSERNDMFVHTKDYHSAHIIIKSENREIPPEVILYAAEICAYYSKARNGEKVPVDYTLKKYVKKIKNTFVGKVFYTNQKTILVNPNNHNED